MTTKPNSIGLQTLILLSEVGCYSVSFFGFQFNWFGLLVFLCLKTNHNQNKLGSV